MAGQSPAVDLYYNVIYFNHIGRVLQKGAGRCALEDWGCVIIFGPSKSGESAE